MMISKKALTVIWAAILQWARVGMNALVFLVLSRWLSLSEIGTVAVIQAPIILLQSLLTSMLPDFIIQEKFLSQKRLSSIFWFSCVIGIVLLGLIILCTPLLTSSLNDPNAYLYALSLSICPLVFSLSSVFDGLLQKELQTKKLAVRTAISSFIAGVIAIILGYYGYGAWSIIVFVLLNTIISATITIYSCSWRPSLQISLPYLRVKKSKIFALGGRQFFGAAAIPTIQYSIAYQLGTADVGIFQIALRLYTLVDSLLMAPYRFVVMPIFAKTKKQIDNLSQNIMTAISLGSIIASPAFFGLIIICPAIIPFILGEKNGLPCVLITQLLALSGLIAAPTNIIKQILIARGYIGIVFKRSILMYFLNVVPTFIAGFYSLTNIALTYGLVGGLSSLILSLFFAKKYLHLDLLDVFRKWLHLFFIGSTILLSGLSYMFVNEYIGQILSILIISPVIYISALYFLARKDFMMLLDVVKRK